MSQALTLEQCLRSATIEAAWQARTKDAWSLESRVDIEGRGGLSTISAHLIEFNWYEKEI